MSNSGYVNPKNLYQVNEDNVDSMRYNKWMHGAVLSSWKFSQNSQKISPR